MVSTEAHKCWSVSTTGYVPDGSAPLVAIHFQKAPRETEHGRTISLRFPALLVPDFVEGAEDVAAKIAAILNEHWPEGDD